MAKLIINKGNYNVPQLIFDGTLTLGSEVTIGGKEEYDVLRSVFAHGGICTIDGAMDISGTVHHFMGVSLVNAVDESVDKAFEFITFNLVGDIVPSDLLNAVHGNVYLDGSNLKCKMIMSALVS